eukprot:m.49991 g.49991  ORF g.49991 m.49991 type:complete len:55 (+) comp11539_c0_seq2:295-459(+)
MGWDAGPGVTDQRMQEGDNSAVDLIICAIRVFAQDPQDRSHVLHRDDATGLLSV